jgi:ATP-dependent Clp protease protease subunit
MPDHDEPEKEKERDVSPPTTLTESLRDRLFKSRTMVVSGEIQQQMAAHVVAQLLALDKESSEPITMFINSQGGHVRVRRHDSRHRPLPARAGADGGNGWVASAGALIYVAVPRERASVCQTHASFCINLRAVHSVTRATSKSKLAEILAMRERINRIMAP